MAGPEDPRTGTDAPVVENSRKANKEAKLQSQRELEEICAFIRWVNNVGDFDNPRYIRLYDPGFRFNLLDSQICYTRNEYFEWLRDTRKRFPKWHVELLELTIEVYEKQTKAKCWVLMKHTGHPPGTEREGLNIFFWKRDEEKGWVCYNHQGFRGVAPLPLPLAAASPVDEQ